jgi:hypothetical protein
MTRRLPLLRALLLVGLVGCELLPAPNPDGQAYRFPHPEDFDGGDAHGAPWLASPEGCEQCHRSEQRILMVLSCADCHPSYPHPEGFADPDAHGVEGAEGGPSCAPCHGSGEAQPVQQEGSACRDCHQPYPHRLTYAEPWIHGPEAQASPETCTGCHGEDWTGGERADSCFDCHALYPHPDASSAPDSGMPGSWSSPTAHGAAALVHEPEACGGSCHGTDYEGGLSGVSCFGCHAAFPHGDDIRVEHRSLVEQLGEASCLGCHSSNTGFPASFGCTETCHGAAP